MSCGAFARGAHSMFSKPTIRKACHRKCSSSSSSSPERSKLDAEELKNKSNCGDNSDGSGWIPHERTGIYYPKGQEKVMDGIPQAAAKDFGVHWFTLPHKEDPSL